MRQGIPKAVFVVVVLLLFALASGTVFAQTRVSDRDIEKMMNNLKDDAGKFKSNFNSGVGKTTIRKTTREKQSKQLVNTFQQQTEGLLKGFKKNKQADAEMKVVLNSADQIGKLLNEVTFDQRTMDSWKKLQEELDFLTKALAVGTPTAK